MRDRRNGLRRRDSRNMLGRRLKRRNQSAAQFNAIFLGNRPARTEDAPIQRDGRLGTVNFQENRGILGLVGPIRMSRHRHGDGISSRRCDIDCA